MPTMNKGGYGSAKPTGKSGGKTGRKIAPGGGGAPKPPKAAGGGASAPKRSNPFPTPPTPGRGAPPAAPRPSTPMPPPTRAAAAPVQSVPGRFNYLPWNR